MKFLVNIEEVINQNFEVEAETMEDAVEIAIQKYKSREFMLEECQVLSAMVEVYDETTGCWSKQTEI